MDIPWLEFSTDLVFEPEADWPMTGAGSTDAAGGAGGDDGGTVSEPVPLVARVSVWTP